MFKSLHHSGRLLILPNIWDVSGALLLKDLQFPAVATASAAVAITNGYEDGEKIPFAELLRILKKMVQKLDLPVSADIESGYAGSTHQLGENIKKLIGAGIVGINLEDTNKKTKRIYPIEQQCERIQKVRSVAQAAGIELFINARTDVYIRSATSISAEEKLKETIKRGLAYREAGASGFFPIAMKEKTDLLQVVSKVDLPLNVITIAGIPSLSELEGLGVARVSLGPSLLKFAMQSMKHLAEKLKSHEGLNDIFENEITSDYLRMLVT